MTDLFDDQPEPKGPSCVAEYGFAEFWAAYPAGTRRVAKRQCEAKWFKYRLGADAKHIIAHVEWMKTQPDWIVNNGAFVCAPLVYLNKQCWIDWTPEPERPKKPDVLAELKAHKGSKPSAAVLAEIKRVRQGVTA